MCKVFCLWILLSSSMVNGYMVPLNGAREALRKIIQVTRNLCSRPFDCDFYFGSVAEPVEPTYWEIFLSWITWSKFPEPEEKIDQGFCIINAVILIAITAIFVIYFALSRGYFSMPRSEKPILIPFLVDTDDENEDEMFEGNFDCVQSYQKCPCNLYVDETGDMK